MDNSFKKSRHFQKDMTIRNSMRRMVLRVAALFMVLMILINIGFTVLTARQMEHAAQQSLSDQTHALDNALQSVENALDEVISQNSYSLQSFQQTLDETELYLISGRFLNALQTSALQTNTEDVLFIFSEPNSRFVLAAPEMSYGDWMAMRDTLAGLCSSGDAAAGNWIYREIHGRGYFIYLLKGSRVSYGGCVPADTVADTESTWDRYLSVRNTDGGDTVLKISADGTIGMDDTAVAEDDGNFIGSRSSLGAFALSYNRWDILGGAAFLRNTVFLALLSVGMLFAVSRVLDRFSRRITEPIGVLDQKMKEFRGDEENAKLESGFEFQELEEVRTTFNSMTDRIRTLKMDAYEERIHRQKTEYEFLRLQIKPHFYLNCLNQIFILSQMGKTEAVSALTVKMMNYFRYVLRQDEELVPLREELAHIDDYLYIQKVRYPAGFHYEQEVPQELGNTKITSLLLITFVENSLKYAYSAYGDLTIRIRAWKEEGDFVIEVSDSGPGFPDSVLEVLEDGEAGEIRKEDGRKCIGIRNAVQRLRYAFGDAASITFANGTESGIGLPGGTVTIRLPWKAEE